MARVICRVAAIGCCLSSRNRTHLPPMQPAICCIRGGLDVTIPSNPEKRVVNGVWTCGATPLHQADSVRLNCEPPSQETFCFSKTLGQENAQVVSGIVVRPAARPMGIYTPPFRHRFRIFSGNLKFHTQQERPSIPEELSSRHLAQHDKFT